MMLVDYHIHALSHGEYSPELPWYREYIMRAAASGVREIGFSEHDEYLDRVNPGAIRGLAQEFPQVALRVGLEVEFRHGLEPEMARRLQAVELDYLIGSVHFLGEWNFDYPDERHRFRERGIDSTYEQYFAEVGAMINSGCFDIVGHLDLVKIWGDRPSRRMSYYVEPLLKAIRLRDMVVEINGGGLRKPVGEVYPEPALLELLYAASIPITLGSDAHHPDQVGEHLDICLELARKAGYRKLAGFQHRQYYLLHV